MRFITILGALMLAALSIAACGSSRSSGSSRDSAGYAATAPAQIIKDTTSAMSSAKSFQAGGHIDVEGSAAQATLAIQAPKNLEATLQQKGQLIRVIALGGSGSFLYANDVFWKKELGANASAAALKMLADHWFRTPASTSTSLVKDLGDVTPAQLASCLEQAAVRPKLVGSSTTDGQHTVELHLSGGRPGSSPGNLFVATASPHYPVRFTQTGKAVPGGSGSCANGPTDSDSGTGSLDFSRWNAVTVTAPANAKPLPGG